ncbi:hypothetical protein GCM10010172_07340 [Paractinoplanes ferrugineus]|uniref:Uncharacterized protein n=1 Tax=Paractinoplanes ferrugineus TaxID=113564 RepID=A0A919MQX4_9ACTN|nr:hypothetical protein [Actinoplanes ferrugineus]GIE16787.1 hypothetical protein Afe05nite_86270 [Actinoplanes ferrugineus]
MVNDPPRVPLKPGRSWSGTGVRRQCRVEVADILRGTIRVRGVGESGHLTYQPVTSDGVWLDPITGDYVAAEKALLDATKELEGPL